MKATKQNILRFSCLCLWVLCVLVESAFLRDAACSKAFYTAPGTMEFSNREDMDVLDAVASRAVRAHGSHVAFRFLG